MPRKKKIFYEKQIPDEVFDKKYPGSTFDFSWYNTLIDGNETGYYRDNNGETKILFKLRKKVIRQELQDQATYSFRKLAQQKNYNRGLAAGKIEGAKTARIVKDGQSMSAKSSTSNIAGYYDKPNRQHKKFFTTDVACRKTAFTKNNLEKWEHGLPFIQKCSRIYKTLSRKHYNIQLEEYNKIRDEIKIPNTVFTTVTVNYNWRTSCHKDTGDFSKGLGNLIVTGNDFKGCYLGFPQFKICIKVEPGDFLLMDVHQWHCNTEIILPTPDSFRISYVLYLREHMSKCKKYRQIDKIDYIY